MGPETCSRQFPAWDAQSCSICVAVHDPVSNLHCKFICTNYMWQSAHAGADNVPPCSLTCMRSVLLMSNTHWATLIPPWCQTHIQLQHACYKVRVKLIHWLKLSSAWTISRYRPSPRWFQNCQNKGCKKEFSLIFTPFPFPGDNGGYCSPQSNNRPSSKFDHTIFRRLAYILLW